METNYKATPWQVLHWSTTPTCQSQYYNAREVDELFHLRTQYAKEQVWQAIPYAIKSNCLSALYDYCTAVAVYTYTRILVGDSWWQEKGWRNPDKIKQRARRHILKAYKNMCLKRAQLIKKLV